LGIYGKVNVPQWIKVASKFEEYHVSRLAHPPDSPEVSPCDFWLFEKLKGVLKDRQFNSSDEIQEVIMNVWDQLTFDEMQSAFHNWASRFAWVIENVREDTIE
jgi:hypothetical protein